MDITTIIDILRALIAAAGITFAGSAVVAPEPVAVPAVESVPTPTPTPTTMVPTCDLTYETAVGVACAGGTGYDVDELRRTTDANGNIVLWGDHGYPVGTLTPASPGHPDYVAPTSTTEPTNTTEPNVHVVPDQPTVDEQGQDVIEDHVIELEVEAEPMVIDDQGTSSAEVGLEDYAEPAG